MSEKKFTFYNVGNGQSVLLTLDDETHVLFDILQKTDEVDDDELYADVHASLLKTLPKRNGRRWLSVFSLSHADLDHCQGFDRVFYVPVNKDATGEELIGIDELWISAEMFLEVVNGPAETIRKEAERRLKLWSDPQKQNEANTPGNMIVVFGRTDRVDVAKLPENRRPGAGKLLTEIAGKKRQDLEVFVHCPFSTLIGDEDEERNDKSLILQVVIRDAGAEAAILLGGDSGCSIWEMVLNKTLKYKNEARLEWDVFFVPHHGSYKFFTKKEHEEGRKEADTNPEKSSLKILGYGRQNGWVVCSSRPVKDDNYDDEHPPHFEAVKHYRKCAETLGDKNRFVCLMEHPKAEAPEPLVLRLTSNGLQEKLFGAATITIGEQAASKPARWG